MLMTSILNAIFMRRKEMSGDIIRGRLLNETTYRVWNKVLVHSLSKLAYLSSQEATSFRSSLMFRLFFLAYLRVENIFFSGFSSISSLVPFYPTLCKNRNAERCNVTREITYDSWCAFVLVTINIIQTAIVFLCYDKKNDKVRCNRNNRCLPHCTTKDASVISRRYKHIVLTRDKFSYNSDDHRKWFKLTINEEARYKNLAAKFIM